MNIFKPDKPSERASEEWFRRHLCKRELISEPLLSTDKPRKFLRGLKKQIPVRRDLPPDVKFFFFEDKDNDRTGTDPVFDQQKGDFNASSGEWNEHPKLSPQYPPRRMLNVSKALLEILPFGHSAEDAEMKLSSLEDIEPVPVPPMPSSGVQTDKDEEELDDDVPRMMYDESNLVEITDTIEDEDAEQKQESNDQHFKDDPTDAFGDISFIGMGNKKAKYARLSSDTSPEVLYQLLTNSELWNVPPPNLLITVIGGDQKFCLKPNLKSMFHRGLIKVAQTTEAWILTGGTNRGVAKHVGQAVRDQDVSSSEKGRVVAIGMATWGSIHNRHQLVDPTRKGHYCHAEYVLDVDGQDNLSCLDHNHTHFLLVDDGTQDKYGAEIKLRESLEKYIAEKELTNQASRMKIPVVYVMLSGDTGTLNTIHKAIQNGTPCVVLEGSGRMADVVAFVADLPLEEVTVRLIQDLMKKFFCKVYNDDSSKELYELTKKIQDIITMPDLLTVFRTESNEDVDVAILHALLKASSTREDSEKYHRQLELAMAWDRADIAKDKIFTDESQWKMEQLHSAMFSALVGNQPEFVSLLLENDVHLKDFLKEGTLDELYRLLPNCLFLRRVAKRIRDSSDPFTSETISKETYKLLKGNTLPILPTNTIKQDDVEMVSISEDPSSDNFLNSKNPERDLFLWAILHKNEQLSEIAWEKCQDCVASALAASKILRTLEQNVDREEDSDEGTGLKELADLYEKHAIGVFNKCYSSDKARAHKLLQRPSSLWDGATCLTLALEASNKNFIAQAGVQALLTQMWCGELSVENSVWKVPVCIFFLPLICTPFLNFRHDEEIEKEKYKKMVTEVMRTKPKIPQFKASSFSLTDHCENEIESDALITEAKEKLKTITGYHCKDDKDEQQKQVEPLSGCTRIRYFFSALQVKFYIHILFYFAFLALYAVVLMADFHPTPSISEIVLCIWIFTLACEEFRQLFYDPVGLGSRKKAKLYICDLWNILDVLSIIFFIIGQALRWNDSLLYVGKIVLCVDFVIFCMRLMAIFTINQTLGPKIIIVRRMMKDMFFFMFLLSIWVVAYGVAKHGILIDNENRLSWILRGAIYEPYLSLFGDMPSNIDHTQFDINKCTINGSDALKPKCPVLNDDGMPVFPEWLAIIIRCVYLLFANILLLNLLIAILSYTFQEVQDNTDIIWKFQRYELIYEYISRPIFPPPFIIFCHLYMLLQWLLKKCSKCGRCRRGVPQLEQEEERQLLDWEAVMKDQYLASSKQAHTQSTEQKIRDTADKISTIWDLLVEEVDPNMDSVVQCLARLEEQVSTKHQGRAQESPMPIKIQTPLARNRALSENFTDSYIAPIKTIKDFHVKARQLRYADGQATRFPVPMEMVPWEVDHKGYCPPYYSKAGIKGERKRRLKHKRNPRGRTGLEGRGVLLTFGPNHSLNLILTRWRDCDNFEFLALKDENEKSLILPGGQVHHRGHLPEVLEKLMGMELCQKLKKLLKTDKRGVIHHGYEDDERNTDHAWVENTVLTMDLTHSDLLMDINAVVAQTKGSAQSFEWHEVSRRTRLSSHQRDYLKTVAECKNCIF